MKRFGILFALLFPLSLSALYMGNPALPEIIGEGFVLSDGNSFGLKAGYQGTFVFDRNLKAPKNASKRIDSFEILTNQGLFLLNYTDRFEGYLSVGAMRIDLCRRSTKDNKIRDYHFHDQFTWGAGGRAILFEWGCAVFGIDGKFQWAHPDLRWATLNGANVPSGGSILYREWQVGIGGAYHTDPFIPYIGLTYSFVHAKTQDLSKELELGRRGFSMRSREHFGLVLGCTFSNAKVFDLTVEVKFFDEEAISLAADVKF